MRFSCLLLVLAVGVVRGETAAEVIAAATKAKGGEAMNKLPGASMKFKGELFEGPNPLELETRMVYRLSDGLRVVHTATVQSEKVTIDQTINGSKFKMTTNGLSRAMTEHERAHLQAGLAEIEILRLAPLLDAAKKYTLKLEEPSTVDGKEVFVVAVSNEAKTVTDFRLFIDKSNHLVLKSKSTVKAADGKEIEAETFYSEYKAVQGIQTPHKLVVKHKGRDYARGAVSDVKYLDKVDDKEFVVDE